jgi:hypothetical protein
LSYFSEMARGATRLCAVGKITGAEAAHSALAAGLDLVAVGRAGILHHDFPERCRKDPAFRMSGLPVTVDYLHGEGVSDPFIAYLRNWEGFVAS